MADFSICPLRTKHLSLNERRTGPTRTFVAISLHMFYGLREGGHLTVSLRMFCGGSYCILSIGSLAHNFGPQNRTTTPAHWKKLLDVVWSSDMDASWIPSKGGFFWLYSIGRRPWNKPRHTGENASLNWLRIPWCLSLEALEESGRERSGSK